MKIKLQEYNPADLLKSEEDIIAYLKDAYDDDPATFVIALGDVVKHERHRICGKGNRSESGNPS